MISIAAECLNCGQPRVDLSEFCSNCGLRFGAKLPQNPQEIWRKQANKENVVVHGDYISVKGITGLMFDKDEWEKTGTLKRKGLH